MNSFVKCCVKSKSNTKQARTEAERESRGAEEERPALAVAAALGSFVGRVLPASISATLLPPFIRHFALK